GQALTAAVGYHLHLDDADGMLVPAAAERLHLPQRCPAGQPARAPLHQAILVQLDRPQHALLPPELAHGGAGVDLVALAVGRETGVGHVYWLVEQALEHQLGVRLLVAEVLDEGAGERVAVEEAARPAAAIQAEGERA